MKHPGWERQIPQWELAADATEIQRKEACILLNGKPTEFTDVHDGPAVYIGRSNEHYDLSESELHNPFSVQEHGRLASCLKYTDHLIEQVQAEPRFREMVYRCHGRPLACWCIPELCHGHVLNLFLVYRFHCGWELERIRSEIKERLKGHVDHLIRQGKVDPAKYQAKS